MTFIAIIPKEKTTDFRDFVNNKAYEQNHSIYYTDYQYNVDSYGYVTWEENGYHSIESIEGWWKEFCPEGNVFHIDEYGFVGYEGLKRITKGQPTTKELIEQETEWREKVVKVIESLDQIQTPLAIEISPLQAAIFRNLPTIVLTGRSVWKNGSGCALTTQVKPVGYKKHVSLSTMPNWFPTADMYPVMDAKDSVISTSFCFIVKNRMGFGNTVIINSAMFGVGEFCNIPNIYSLLTDVKIWKHILLPLAIRPFEQLKEELKNSEMPMTLQIKLFKCQNQSRILGEIEALEKEKAASYALINQYLSSITSAKIQIRDYEDQISAKNIELGLKLNSRTIENNIKAIKNLPYIENVVFTLEGIVFYTTPIQIDDGPFVGGYEITYQHGAKKFVINNIGNPALDGKIAHPHCPQGGSPCLGNYADIFLFFETGEYLAGIELLHDYLSSYNPDDEWGRRLIYWDAEYCLKDMQERGILHKLESRYHEQYNQVFGRNFIQDIEPMCPECQRIMSECECARCRYCNELEEDCQCWICPRCGELVEDGCNCERCPACWDLIENCYCDRCPECNELTNTNYEPHCECERCPLDDSVLEADDERCTECENRYCEHNVTP